VLRGVVEDGTGARRAGVTIEATPDDATGTQTVRATSEGDGTFSLALRRGGLHRVRAYLGTGLTRIEATGFYSPGPDEHKLVLQPLPTEFDVEVVDEQGTLVPKFVVDVVAPRANRAHTQPGPGRARVVIRPSYRPSSLGADRGPVQPGDVLRVRVHDLRDAAGRALDLQGGVETWVTWPVEAVRIVAPAFPALRGVVRATEGRPLAGQPVVAMRPGSAMTQEGWVNAQPAVVLSPSTDAEGRFELAHPWPDEGVVLVARGDDDWLPTRVSRGRGEPAGELVLRPAARARIEVRTPSGAPVPHADVRVLDEAGEEAGSNAWTPFSSRVPADAQGRIEIARLDPERTYELVVGPAREWLSSELPTEIVVRTMDSAHLAPRRISDWRPTDTVVTLEAARDVAGIVVDETGAPAAGAVVQVRGARDWVREGTTWHDGTFLVQGAPAGPVTLAVAWTSGGVSKSPGGPPVEEAARERQRLVLSRARSASVRLATGDVTRLREASARVLGALYVHEGAAGWQRAPDCTFGRFRDAADLGEDGKVYGRGGLADAVVEGLEPGRRYAVWAVLDRGDYIWAEIAAGDLDVELRAEPGARLEFDVSGCEPDATVSLRARDAFGRLLVGDRRLENGRFETGGIPAGEWRVQVSLVRDGTAKLRGEASVTTGAVGRVVLTPVAR
jgi:hypothetical protein